MNDEYDADMERDWFVLFRRKDFGKKMNDKYNAKKDII